MGIKLRNIFKPHPVVNKDQESKTRLITDQYPSNPGYCVICESATIFYEEDAWLRDNYYCITCKSIPRHRAIVNALNLLVPSWRDKAIHESSPYGPSSDFIKGHCKEYSSSQYFPGIPSGDIHNGAMCQNLTNISFDDNSFDLFITQDVFEHVMDPDKAFSEIARVLKGGGVHIFTMPWYPQLQVTRQRAKMNNGEVQYLEDPVYHGNPVDEKGSLVTFDWGMDFCDFIYRASGMTTQIYLHRDRSLGLDGEFLQVFCSFKTGQ